MNLSFIFSGSSILVCILAATCSVAQDLQAIPPNLDPSFWGRVNQPYSLKLTQMSTNVNGSDVPQLHPSETNISRDSAGRERTEAFYNNGKLMTVSIRDPGTHTFTLMKTVDKSAIVIPTPPPVVPPPGTGWTVERLPPRIIAGFPAEGLRFTRAVHLPDDPSPEPVTVIEEDWISNKLSVVLEQTIDNPRTGTITKTVTHFEQAEPDPAFFTIPNDYFVHQVGSSAH